jgi:D-alanine--poly(phosphoribitol) ligase subunit 1
MNLNFDSLSFENRDVNPDKLAFACSDGDISWNEFEKQVNEIIAEFRQIGLPQGHPVIIYGHKEKLFPIAITACFTYGVPYIPVDIIMPKDRLSKIQNISGSQVLVNCANAQIDLNVNVIIGDDLKAKKKKDADYTKLSYNGNAGPLGYIMFTSGSTGEPKGVMVPMRCIKSFVKWFKKDYPASQSTVFMNQAPFSFDISLVEILGTLSHGATAVLNDTNTIRNADLFIKRIEKYNCSFWNSTPSFAYLYLTSPLFTADNLNSLETFLFMGEELTSKLVNRLRNAFPGSKIYNAYGPTEATIVTTLVEITPQIVEKYSTSLPIGYAKYDGEVLIENEEHKEEKEGEIIIAGDHVAAGYLNRDDLTQKCFMQHKSMWAYKTGDHGYKRDALIFFMGRKDDQVKLNGYRIEIGDINKHIEAIKPVIEAVTIPLKVGGQTKSIISFVRVNENISQDTLKKNLTSTLRTRVPEYMIPSDIIVMDNFPVNSNHKIDKLRLLEIYLNR